MSDQVLITVGGTAQTELLPDLVEVIVDTDLFLPGMFSIMVEDDHSPRDGKLKYGDADTFRVGAEVKIEVETDNLADESTAVKATLIVGEITSVEPIFDVDGRARLRVRGYDLLHRLTHGTKTRTYGDANPSGSGIGDDQIISTIVQETGGITGQVVDTSGLSSIKYAYVLQYNQTDLEFLWSRARMYGYQVYVQDKKLYFQKADAHRGAESDKPSTLTWGQDLRSFRPRLTLADQVEKAVVKGWDPGTKAAIEGTSSSDASKTAASIGLNKKGSDVATEVLSGAGEETVTDQPLVSIDQAKAMAAARFAQAAGAFIQAEGSCRQGDPRLIAGRIVTIEGVGERYSGDYYVTTAQHVYSRGEYSVTFGATGRTPNSLAYLLMGDRGRDPAKIYGVVTAKVTSLEDPENLGRVQVMYPWLPKYKDADLSSNWARLASPMAGLERGLLCIPEIDDEVLVAFEHGDTSFPYIVGALWNNTDKPPAGTASILSDDKKKVNQRVLRSRSGHLVILDDTEGEEQIIIQDMSEKNSIIFNTKDKAITIQSEGDMTITAGGALTIEATGAISMTSQDAASVKATKDVSLESSGGKGTVKGSSGLALQSTGTTEIKGTQVSVGSDAQTEVKSSGMVKVQGSLVQIN